jgi:hypothetical protein
MRHYFLAAGLAASLAISPLITSALNAQVSTVDSLAAEIAILDAAARAVAVAQIDEVPSVGVINLAFGRTVSAFAKNSSPSPQDYQLEAEKNAYGVQRLQRALHANPATRAALRQHGVGVDEVVGVDISSNGSLRLYVLR